ncbi:MAG TPA: DNA alkylation repair protein [Bacteroidia bacterium]|nr:DNA alkylation repair protein [Bacteroidia bacterium]
MTPYTQGIYKVLKKHSNEENAIPMKKYMRNQFDFFGIKSDERRQLCREYLNSNELPKGEELHKVVKELWEMPERELQYFAIELLIKCKKQWTLKDADFWEYLITHKSWWDTVDFLAGQVVGPWFLKFPDQIKSVTGKWNKSENIWLQRMSILFQLKYKKETDLKLLYKYIETLSESKEFFVQKAIGWILREYSKTDPHEVKKYIAENKLMPLSKREGMKVIERGK